MPLWLLLHLLLPTKELAFLSKGRGRCTTQLKYSPNLTSHITTFSSSLVIRTRIKSPCFSLHQTSQHNFSPVLGYLKESVLLVSNMGDVTWIISTSDSSFSSYRILRTFPPSTAAKKTRHISINKSSKEQSIQCQREHKRPHDITGHTRTWSDWGFHLGCWSTTLFCKKECCENSELQNGGTMDVRICLNMRLQQLRTLNAQQENLTKPPGFDSHMNTGNCTICFGWLLLL